MAKIEVNTDRCKGCLLCAEFCPAKIIKASESLNSKGYYPAEQTDASKCTGCAICARMCPDIAITVYR